MAQHKALGRGLNALFSSTQAVAHNDDEAMKKHLTGDLEEGVHQILVNNIRPNRHQPRTSFDNEALNELAESIKKHGVTQPLVVTHTPVPNEYELVVGERRLRASKLAGLKTVPCLIKKFTNQQRFEIALIENLQRENLNAMEEALALDGLMKEYSLTQEQVAKAIGKSRSTVANILRFLRLHEDVQLALRDGKITEGHAKCLAGLTEHAEQLRYLNKVVEENWTVRDLEGALAPTKKPIKKKIESDESKATQSDTKKFEEEIQRVLGRRVEIQSTKGKKGWIRFAFYSPWDLEMLLKKLNLHPDKGPLPDEPPASS